MAPYLRLSLASLWGTHVIGNFQLFNGPAGALLGRPEGGVGKTKALEVFRPAVQLLSESP